VATDLGSLAGAQAGAPRCRHLKTDINDNPGQGCGPFFRADNILQGIIIPQDCTPCTSSNSYPNGVRSMTP
jgi:hypothetical protein